MKKKILRVIFTVIPVVCLVALYLFVAIPMRERKDRDDGSNSKVYQGAYFASATEKSPAYGQSKSYKGGAIFIEPNVTYNMNGGSITGTNKKFGGAVYISSGATFNMKGGSITGCNGMYGGAIYVETGGTLVIEAGTLTGNTANYGPSIYAEQGATVDISPNANISSNDILYEVILDISNEEIEIGADLTTRYITMGSYPQTAVDETMQNTLTAWASSQTPSHFDGVEMYTYTDGNVYVLGQCCGGFTFSSGYYAADGEYLWFKIEPIKWWIINYDGYQDGMTEFWLLSRSALTTYDMYGDSMNWVNCGIRDWLNGSFYENAFTEAERNLINLTNVQNNDGYHYNYTDGSGQATNDYLFLLSLDEVQPSSGTSAHESIFVRGNYSFDFELYPTDYANLMLNGFSLGHAMLRTGVYYDYEDNAIQSYYLWDSDFAFITDAPYNTGSNRDDLTYIRPSMIISLS